MGEGQRGEAGGATTATADARRHGLQVSAWHTLADLEPLRDRWIAALEAQPRPRFDQHPDHFTRAVTDIDGREPLVVTVTDGDRLLGVAPFLVEGGEVRWGVRSPRGRRTLARFAIRTADLQGETFVGDPSRAIHAALLSGTLEAAKGIDVVQFRHVDVDTELWKLLESAHGPATRRSRWIPAPPTVKFGVGTTGSIEEYRAAQLTRKQRANAKREWRLLAAAAGGDLAVDVVTHPDQVPGFLADADEVYADSWHHRAGAPAMGTHERREAQMRFMAEHGWLRAYVLRAAGRPIAYISGYQSYGVVHASRTAYRDSWAARSPGKALWLQAIEDLHASPDHHLLDFGYGDWQYKRILATDERWASNALLIERAPRTLAIHAGPRAWSWAKRRGMEVAVRTGHLERVLRWTRKRLSR